jgi:hypothetical protein
MIPVLTLSNLPDAAPQDRVRVWPAHEGIRKHIIHPSGRIRFGGTMDESVEWPNDAFTKRRILDGDVFTTPPFTVSDYSSTVELYPVEDAVIVEEKTETTPVEGTVEDEPVAGFGSSRRRTTTSE